MLYTTYNQAARFVSRILLAKVEAGCRVAAGEVVIGLVARSPAETR
jgi:hypothetical protein